ncbi:MAG: ubiquinol-cytochrome C chaperone family protein [Hyphomonadaceae bacterium]
MALLEALGLRPNPNRAAAERLLAATMAAARQPALYGPGRAADTFDGRFQMAALHGALVARRLRAEPGGEALAQLFADVLFRSFDEGLREAGVGDLSVPKHMKKIARAFLGRFAAYGAALAAGDRTALAGALSRNVWDAEGAPFAAPLADYALAAAAGLAARPLDELAKPECWPIPPS